MLRLLSSTLLAALLALFLAAAALPSHAQPLTGTLKKLADKRKRAQVKKARSSTDD